MMFHFDKTATEKQATEPPPLTYALPACQGDGEFAVHVWVTAAGEPQAGERCQCGKVTYTREER